MNVSDIMTQEVITVGKETSLKEAAGLLAKFRVHGMPVVNEDKKVIGIVTESDFFMKDSSNIFLPTFLDFMSKKKSGEEMSSDLGAAGSKTKIADIMTTECITLRPDAPVEKLIQVIKEKNFNSVPVVDESGTLVGIVSVMDVIKLF